MELQYEFGSREPELETKWQTLQARCSPDEKQDIQLCSKWLGLSYSVITRIFWRALIRRMREMPQVKADVSTEITQVTDQIETYLPIIIRQKKVAPRMF